jgi:hypothetical protein
MGDELSVSRKAKAYSRRDGRGVEKRTELESDKKRSKDYGLRIRLALHKPTRRMRSQCGRHATTLQQHLESLLVFCQSKKLCLSITTGRSEELFDLKTFA